jgi:predicted RNA-binding protein
MYNLNLICQHIRSIKDDVTINDINENVYLIDIYNEKTFTNGQITSMNLLLDTFFKRNHISLL